MGSFRRYDPDGVLIYENNNGVEIKSNLGNKIAAFATPIARVLSSGCIDPATKQLKPTSGCGKMKERLNAGMPITEAIKLRMQGK